MMRRCRNCLGNGCDFAVQQNLRDNRLFLKQMLFFAEKQRKVVVLRKIFC
jgi:hypothetical protein